MPAFTGIQNYFSDFLGDAMASWQITYLDKILS